MQDQVLIGNNQIRYLEKIGQGGNGRVYKATWGYKTVAVKELTKFKDEDFKKEENIHSKLSSPQIVKFIGIIITNNGYGIVMEYMSRGSLCSVLENNKRENFSWNLRKKIALDISLGLSYLHQNQIIHRDLKSLNILLDGNYNAKLADFGSAKANIGMERQAAVGKKREVTTPGWVAPEIIIFHNSSYNSKTDIYSFGIVLWELASHKIPYNGANKDFIFNLVVKGFREGFPQDTPRAYRQLVQMCWAGDPYARPELVGIISDIKKMNFDLPQIQLELAAKRGDFKTVKLIAERIYTDLNDTLRYGSALLYAIQANNEEAVVALLIGGAGNKKNWSFPDTGDCAPHVAVLSGNAIIVSLLLDYKFPLNQQNRAGYTPIALAGKLGDFKTVKLIAERIYTDLNDTLHYGSALLDAIQANNAEAVVALLIGGAGNKKNWYFPATENYGLHLAVLTGNAKIVNLLLDYMFPLSQQNRAGYTPIALAAKLGDFKTVKLIAERIYTDLNDTLHYGSALLDAIQANNAEAVEALLKAGAENDKNWNCDGNFALHLAVLSRNATIVRLLLDYKFPLDQKNKAGLTPIQLIAKLDVHVDDGNLNKIRCEIIKNKNLFEKLPKDFVINLFCHEKIRNNLTQKEKSDFLIYHVEHSFENLMKRKEIVQMEFNNFSEESKENFLKIMDCSNMHNIDKKVGLLLCLALDKNKSALDYLKAVVKNSNSPCAENALAFYCTKISVGAINQYLDQKSNSSSSITFFHSGLGCNRANVYQIFLERKNNTFFETAVILLALFSSENGKDLKIQCAKALDFVSVMSAREYFVRLIKEKLGSTFENNLLKLNKIIGEIVLITNSNEVILDNILNDKFDSLMSIMGNQEVENKENQSCVMM